MAKTISNPQEIISTLFKHLEQDKIPYCILHSYDTLPAYSPSDIDIVIDPEYKHKLDYLIDKVAKEIRISIIQKLYYDVPHCYYYIIGRTDSSLINIVAIDCLIDEYGINRYYLPSKTLLEGRFRYKNFYVPSYGIQTVYLLIKKTIKGKLFDKNFKKLRELYLLNNKEIYQFLMKYFGNYLGMEIFNAIRDANIEGLKFLIPHLKKEIKKRGIQHLLIRIAWSFNRIIERVLYPTGELIVILSPDGGGKTSVGEHSLKTLLRGFRRTRYLHWRPGLLPQIRALIGKSNSVSKFVISNPNSPKKRSKITSFLRLFYYTFDYIIGYYLKIFPMKIKTTAVIMDRYYYDIIVDPMRYGFNLPNWLLKLPLKMIPKPDVTVYLDNKPEEIYKRKQELNIEELQRQVNTWREFIQFLPNAHIITTDKPLENVVNDVTKLVFERRAELTRKILKIEPDESYYLWNTKMSGYIALPSKKICRWIIPYKPMFATKAWDIYLPYSYYGKIYKLIMKTLAKLGLYKLFIRNKINIKTTNSEQALLFKKYIVNVFKRDDFILAISTGTPGPYRKITAMIVAYDGEILGYVKIGETDLAIKRIKNEAEKLKQIVKGYSFKNGKNIDIIIPKNLYEGELENAYFLIQSPVPFKGQSGSRYFNDDYNKILQIFIDNTLVKKRFIDSEFFNSLKSGINNYILSYRELLQKCLNYLEKHIGNQEITFTLSHGDFAPWNMLWSKDKKKVFIFDWESSCFEAPAGIDMIHFIFMTGFLTKNLRGEKLLKYCINPKHFEYLDDRVKSLLLDKKCLLLIYLLKMTVDEDSQQILCKSAVERRQLIKKIIEMQ
jgi:thymidylate kinase